MIKALIRRFVPNCEQTKDKQVRERYSVLAGILGICGNGLLFVVKLTIGILMNSISIMSDAFNNLITRCTPQAYQMTAEDKAHSRQVAKEIFREDKDRILKEAGQDLLETVEMKVESDLRTQRIRQMSEAGVLDEYTKVSNAVDDVGILARFFKNRRDKKKK